MLGRRNAAHGAEHQARPGLISPSCEPQVGKVVAHAESLFNFFEPAGIWLSSWTMALVWRSKPHCVSDTGAFSLVGNHFRRLRFIPCMLSAMDLASISKRFSRAMSVRLRGLNVLLVVVFVSHSLGQAFAVDGIPDFEADVAPILVKRCVECHQTPMPAGGLNLTSNAGLLSGGDSGAAINLGALAESHLIERIEIGDMPPEQQGRSQKLPENELSVLTRWVDSGASWPEGRELELFERTNDVRAGRDWWSLQPIVKPTPPSRSVDEHPIDAFVRARLDERGWQPAPRADKRTLIRRVYYDLIGLAPTSKEISEFVENDSPDAWSELIDDLLQRPQYGERWGRYWLDLVRYADTSGYERDQEKPHAWRYRDWVVSALNSDMPYQQFVTHQIAGDEIEAKTEQSLVATGFLRLGTWNDEPNEPKDYVYDRLEDMVHTTASSFIGLTVKCARCHTHKFDPIEQDDYYRFASAFWPGPIEPRDNAWLGGPNLFEIGYDNILGWTDVSATPKPLHVLKNGERDKPLHEVTPASISTIASLFRSFDPPGEDSKTTTRRLQLARWITDNENPLTPRVMVNRVWQHHFGQAIVRTPNNFGFLADPPTHPQLLDWLAAEFYERGGSIKEMHRLILTSETWRQSSIHPKQGEYATQDSGNRLWWRANRRRLDAEAIRDSMLLSTGELNLFVGGESFKASVSPAALEGLSRGSVDYNASPKFQQKRRSLYMYIKRGLLPPMMTTFDLCDATQSCGQRDVTTVPTQALTLMNNEFVHECAEYLAGDILQSEVDRDAQIKTVWSRILRRDPSEAELRLAREHLKSQYRLLTNPEETAEPQSSVPDDEPSIEVVDQQEPKPSIDLADALALHIRADNIKPSSDDGKVLAIKDLSGNGLHAVQTEIEAQPTLDSEGINGQSTLRFDGESQYVHITGQPLVDQPFTIFAVISDQHDGIGHRSILSNWSAAKNTNSSLFLGLTGENIVRLSDAYSFAGEVTERRQPFILAATNGLGHLSVHQNGQLLSSIGQSLFERKLDGNWVIGKQGNHKNEFWKGLIAEVRVYNRALSPIERKHVEAKLSDRYAITLFDDGTSASQISASRSIAKAEDSPTMQTTVTPVFAGDAEKLAMASLCLVLMNSNEFLYVD